MSVLQEIGISGILLFSQGLLNSMSGVAMGWAAMMFTIWMIGGDRYHDMTKPSHGSLLIGKHLSPHMQIASLPIH